MLLLKRNFRLIGVLLVSLALIACRPNLAEDRQLTGHILLWHGWRGEEVVVLNQILEQFTTIYPGVTIIDEYVPQNRIGESFLNEARLGAGPDLLIAPARWEQILVDAEVIQDLGQYQVDTSSFVPAAITQVRYRDRLYALPLSLHVYALYYNKTMVTEPATTLHELLEQADRGERMALDASFYGAFWGVQALGGQLFDDRGRVRLDQGGFAAWLEWLKRAQKVPNIFLSNDEGTLYSLFQQARVAYYVGGPDRLPELQELLGTESVGVTPLPTGPSNAAGPFLQAEALMFNASSSPRQTEVALALGRFLTNVEQQTKLALQAGRIPANAGVKIDARISPAMAGFIAQRQTALPLPNIPQMLDVIVVGDELYVQVLEGVVDPADAAQQLTAQVNSRYGFTAVDTE
ncbi:extracellular solute-binding protein [Chloroflexi bacterium TSY]|nr:extracellular solute-binding protein [Chloroflexi bacterium TSY]